MTFLCAIKANDLVTAIMTFIGFMMKYPFRLCCHLGVI